MHEKVLIVDDSLVNRKLLRSILTKEGYALFEAVDGEEAVVMALQILPDIILLDIMMPKKDGYEVCKELKTDERTFPIPIIFLSAMIEEEDKIKGLDLGAADYVTKPFNKGEVLARVRAQLKIRSLTKSLIEANRELEEKQKRLEEDLKAGAVIQASLIPSPTSQIEGTDTAWIFKPCDRVGGDLFNFFRLDETRWSIYIFDVSGHGVPAAMVSVSLSQMLRPKVGFLLKKSITPPPHYIITPPAEVLTLLDREYPLERFDKFFTMAYMVFDVRSGLLSYSIAAHPPPIVVHADGAWELLVEGGTIVGMGGILPFEEGQRVLKPGDRVFLYTDGIVEYGEPGQATFGQERLCTLLASLRGLSLPEGVSRVLGEVMAFGKNLPPGDDITLMGFEYKGYHERVGNS